MKETQIIVTIKENGETTASMTAGEVERQEAAAGVDEYEEITEQESERYAVASDLANICEYLEDSEVIKIRLIINKAEKRKERTEGGG